ncbi:MAG: hypothetical protein IJ677_08695 [Alphaproteobacteria bacterium]|nr:hypothetical protein [Alphaproteobacteria bacterium]
MNKIYVNLKRFKSLNYNGLIIVISLILALITLCYVLLHNPYQKLHEQIFQTAANIRSYYSDRPSYWKLNTETAIDDMLVGDELLKHSEYDFKIGIGADGDTALPSDITFDIVLSGVNKSTCIGLVEAKVTPNQQLGLQKITVINSDETIDFEWGDAKHPLPITKYAARNVCKPTQNTILWNFK